MPVLSTCTNLNFSLESIATLPGREKQLDYIKEILLQFEKGQQSGHVLFVSGVSGTGKTATVTKAIELFQSRTNKVAKCRAIHVNGMETLKPITIYQHIYSQVFSGKKIPSPQQCLLELNRIFCYQTVTASNKWILVADEVGYLMTRDQKVIYSFLEWANITNSKLLLIAISNTMNLNEELLPKCNSRLGLHRLDFFPYTTEQILLILSKRLLVKETLFKKSALEFCARKVSEYSGDIRRGIHVCRKALQNAQEGQKITIAQIKAAEAELFSSPYCKTIQCLPFMAKLLIVCVILSVRSDKNYSITETSHPEISLTPVYIRYETLSMKHMPRYKPSLSIFYHLLDMLEKFNFLTKVIKLKANAQTEDSDKHKYEDTSFENVCLRINAEIDELVSELRSDPVCASELCIQPAIT